MSAENEGISLNELNLERIKEVTVSRENGGLYQMKATDLREILARYEKEDIIPVPSELLYMVLHDFGVKVYGFEPNKTTLRQKYGWTMREINEILPGSYTTKEADAEAEANPMPPRFMKGQDFGKLEFEFEIELEDDHGNDAG